MKKRALGLFFVGISSWAVIMSGCSDEPAPCAPKVREQLEKGKIYGALTPLMNAIVYDERAAIDKQLSNINDINYNNNNNARSLTPLMVSAMCGNTYATKKLLAAGADVTVKDDDGDSLLFFVYDGDDVEILQQLLDAGLDVNDRRAGGGWTPLISFCHEGKVEMPKTLIAAGADIDAQDDEGFTALIAAASEGHLETVQVLLAAGADVNIADEDGWTPLIWAASEGYTEMVQALVEAQADLNVRDEDGATALSIAATNEHEEIVTMLKAAGARE